MSKTLIIIFLVSLSLLFNLSAQEKEQSKIKSHSIFITKESTSLSPFINSDYIEWMIKNKKLISADFEKAITELPLLAYSYSFLVLEVESLFEYQSKQGRYGYKPDPNGDEENEELIHWKNAWDWFYQERREYLEKLREAIDELPLEEIPPAVDRKWKYCNDIELKYLNAQKCVENYLTNPPQTEEEWDEYQNCLEAIQDYIDSRDYCADYW